MVIRTPQSSTLMLMLRSKQSQILSLLVIIKINNINYIVFFLITTHLSKNINFERSHVKLRGGRVKEVETNNQLGHQKYSKSLT